MSRQTGTRFRVEAALAALTGALLLLTLVSREWIEVLFGVDPDGGDGSLEWAIVGALLVTTVVFTALARTEWRRAATREG
jgi:hypothetical protein